MVYCWLVLCMVKFLFAYDDYYSSIEYLDLKGRDTPKEPNYNQSFFLSLENYHVNAIQVPEGRYPWIARIVHSRTYHFPHICTAVCIEDRIFITAARCIFSLKVSYTSVIYDNQQLPAIAFVVPSKATKQSFDDIGFIVVNDEHFQGRWVSVELFSETNRTDNNFVWFTHLNLPKDSTEHVVIGYASQKDFYRIKSADKQFNLTELKVIVNINICPQILIYKKLITGFHVPCYHSCSVREFQKSDVKCLKYHGAEGSAVFNVRTQKLFGIATWGAYFASYELPVGFSVPNSKNFFEDYTCARRIKWDKSLLVADGYYQALCKDIK